jgi:hypothetical protein
MAIMVTGRGITDTVTVVRRRWAQADVVVIGKEEDVVMGQEHQVRGQGCSYRYDMCKCVCTSVRELFLLSITGCPDRARKREEANSQVVP